MVFSICYAFLDEIAENLKEIQLGGLLLLWNSNVQLSRLNWKWRSIFFSWGAGLGLRLIGRSWCVYVFYTSTMLLLVAEYLLWHQSFIINIIVTMVRFLLHVCVDSRVNEVIVWAMIAQFIVFVFLRARFHVAFCLAPFRFEAFQGMNRSLTKIVIWAFGVRRSAISLAEVSGQVAFTLDCL